MDPVTLTGVSMAATAIGGGVSAFGAASAGKSSAAMYNYQAGIARMNQAINKQNADYERKVGEVQAEQSGIKQRQVMGQIKAQQGGSNLDITSGSHAEVQKSQQDTASFEQGLIRSNAARRAFGYETEAAQNEAQSSVYGMAAKKSEKAGMLGMISSLLGTAGSVATKWMDASKAGIGTGGPKIAYEGTGEWWNG